PSAASAVLPCRTRSLSVPLYASVIETGPPGGGGGGGALMPLRVTIEIPFVPVWPTASRAVTVSVCVPSPTTVVSNANEIGPAVLRVVLPAARPSSGAVRVFEAPDVPSIHTVAQAAAPLTVAPGVGCVIHTCRPPPPAIVNVRPFEVPPPDGFITVTVAEPAVATSLAPMAALSCVAPTKVVARAAPFHCTVEPATKFVPLTVRVNAPLPAATLV